MGVDSETIPEDDAVGTDDIVGKLATKKRGGTEKEVGIKDEPRLGWLARYCRYCDCRVYHRYRYDNTLGVPGTVGNWYGVL